MSLRSLVLCSDEKVARVLRRVLSDLEIGVEHCGDADSAVRKLTRRRFEAVIVDCFDEPLAAKVFSSVRSAPCNRYAIAIALIDHAKDVRSAFSLGAHFVLYKSISSERTKNSLRAARALMKCERRRNTRVAVEIPVALSGAELKGKPRIVTSDMSEGGMAVKLPRRLKKSGPLRVKFSLPSTDHVIECAAEIAWENARSQSGIRFVSLSREQRDHLKSWVARHCPDIEQADPPVPCKLTDVSPGGCYLQTSAPFPVGSRVLLRHATPPSMSLEGIVRAVHPETGMGVEFVQMTSPQREQLEELLHHLNHAGGPVPIEVEPEGLDDAAGPLSLSLKASADPLLALFHRSRELSPAAFHSELLKQRTPHAAAQTASD